MTAFATTYSTSRFSSITREIAPLRTLRFQSACKRRLTLTNKLGDVLDDTSSTTVRSNSTNGRSDIQSGPRRIFVIDGFNLLYRSYFALLKTTMTSKTMFDTRAVFGFANTLASILNKYVNGDSVVVVFEGERKPGQVDHRRAVYPEYKSNRAKTPAGIIGAIPWVKRLIVELGLCVLEEPLFEADDVIGTFVRRASAEGIETVIVSVDKDFMQLLRHNSVSILRPGSKSKSFQSITEDSYREEFAHLHPSQYVDVLTLIGDTADAIKGVPGIGPKTAPLLIQRFGSLENLLAAARAAQSVDQLKQTKRGDQWWRPEFAIDESDWDEYKVMRKLLTKARAENLVQYEQRTILMKSMISIRTNVNLPNVPWFHYQRKSANCDAVQDIWRRLEFTSPRLLSQLLRWNNNQSDVHSPSAEINDFTSNGTEKPHKISDKPVQTSNGVHSEQVERNYVVLQNDSDLKVAFENVTGCVGCACILKESEMGTPELEGIAITTDVGRSHFIDCNNRSELPDALKDLLEDGRIEKAGWFLKETVKALLNSYGIFLRGRLFDVRIAADLIESGRFSSDLTLVDEYVQNGILDGILPSGTKRLGYPLRADDALAISDIGFRLAGRLKEDLKNNELNRVAELVEFPLIPVIAEMELHGVPLKLDDLKSFGKRTRELLRTVEEGIQSLVPALDDGRPFRPTATKDVAEVLFQTWKVPIKAKRTRTGTFTTNKAVLKAVAEDSGLLVNQREFGRLMLEYREIRAVLNSSTKGLLQAIRPDERVRCTFVQESSPSGRLSTSKPNLQAIPVRSELGRELRRTIVAKPGFGILCADYSQIELRILASLSCDKDLRGAFSRGGDVHTAVAATFFDIEESTVTTQLRSSAKQAVYGILYGMGNRGLAQHLRVSVQEAESLINLFRRQFSTLYKFTLSLVAKARERGFAETETGRRMLLPALLTSAPQERRAAERLAVNFPIQGTQADMIKIAMTRIATRLREGGAKSKLILQLHDELILEVAEDEREDVEYLVRDEMTNALQLSGVEVVVNIVYGTSWGASNVN